jgi:hypothetical protein
MLKNQRFKIKPRTGHPRNSVFPGGDPPVPDQVTGVQITGTTSSSVSASWNSANGATSYNAYVNDSLHTGGIASTNATLGGLASDTTFQISVAGQNSAGEGLKSSVISATTEAGTGGGEGDLSALRAFPGAEGSAAFSEGGRGGTVLYVTNLNNSGTGSLRAACESLGRRIVVFRTSGTIALTSPIYIDNPHITIAGQTSPNGICVSGKALCSTSGMYWGDLLIIRTHDVLIQHMRVRQGHPNCTSNPEQSQVGCLAVGESSATPRRIMFDHLTLSWASGTITGAWHNNNTASSAAPREVTWSHCLVAESIRTNSAGCMNFGASTVAAKMNMVDYDVHRCMLATNSHRLPLIQTPRVRFINNIVYNWGYHANNAWGKPTLAQPGVHVDVINNIYSNGPPRSGSFMVHARTDVNGTTDINALPSIYITGNLATFWNGNEQSDNWPMVARVAGIQDNGDPSGALTTDARRYAALSPAGRAITVLPTAQVENHVSENVGANKKIDSNGYLVNGRDASDARTISWYQTKNWPFSNYLWHENDVGGFPNLSGGTLYTSTANDGIADAWKSRNGITNLTTPLHATVIPRAWNTAGWTYMDLFLAGMDIPT